MPNPECRMSNVGWLRAAASLFLLLSVVASGDDVAVWQVFPWLKGRPMEHPADRDMMPEGEALAQGVLRS